MKSNQSASRRLAAVALSLSAPLAYGGPTGGSVTSGVGSIAQSGGTTTVTQGSAHLSLNWRSFNVGAQEGITFVQPSASAIAVNRIQDVNGSQILGRISANGQVFLINPNGILFGRGAQVNVGALIASTLDLSDASLNTGARSFSGAGTGSIVNQGSLDAASGGYVALLGHSVVNQGSMTAPLGFVGLGAGSAVTLNFQGSRMVGIQVDQSALNALADNGGLIRADGGQVVMNAGAKDALLASAVNNSGTVEARTVEHQEGRIVLLGGMLAGTVALSGALDASAPQGATAGGGFVETSAAQVRISAAARVTTAAAAGGLGSTGTGTWLIDPSDFTISQGTAAMSGSGIGAATLAQSLLSNNVSIATSSANTGSEMGDIHVNAAVSWSANKLTLTAHRDININAVMSANGAASLDLQPGGHVNAGFNNDGSFAGRVDFLNTDGSARSGANFLKIGPNNYTVIGTDSELRGMNASTHYALGSNITTTADFTAIPTFTKSFNGLGHTIANLTVSGGANTGLFATATGAAISNVGLLGGSISGAAGTGALVGYLDSSTIRNSFSTASVSGAAGTGGLVGSMVGAGSAIHNSHATGNVGQTAGGAGTGGLVGSLASGAGNISSSYATGQVTSTGTATGGLVGSTAASGTVSDSYATGRVQSDGAGTGGLVGSSEASGGISNSYAMGNVESVAAGTGGLVGSNTSGAIFRSYALGGVNGGGAGTGGLVGSNTSGTISESFAAGSVSGSARSIAAPGAAATVGASTGGLVGSNGGTIVNTYAAGHVTGYAAGIGGLVGNNTGTIDKSYAAGTVAAGTGGTGLGGLLGLGVADTNSYRITGNAPAEHAQNSTSVSSAALANFTASDATHFGGNPDWDFTTVWAMPASTASYLFPIFKGLVKEVTVTAGNASKTYDGLAYSARNTSTTSSAINLALISVGYATTPAIVNAGTYAITPTLTVSNTYLSPYVIVRAVTGSLTVAAKALSATATAANKTYDGTTAANATLSLSGLVTGETLDSTTTASFNNQNVGLANQVTVNTATLIDGTGLASNYTLAAGQVANASISAKAVSVTASASNKTYDGNTAATLSGVAVTGLVGSQTLALTAQFGTQDVGTGKAVSVSLADGTNGGLASNYSLASSPALSANITAKALSATATAANKTYDGSTAASATLSLSGLVTGETLDSTTTASFNNQNVGLANQVTVNTATLIDGTGLASNYTLAAGQVANASISAKAVSVTASASNKTYDGSTAATLSGVAVTGLVGSQTLALAAQFDTQDVGTGKAVSVSLADGTNGGLASNYSLTAISPALTADIQAVQSAGLAPAARMESGEYSAQFRERFASAAPGPITAEQVIDGGLKLP